MRYYKEIKGNGIVNSLINKLPFELHVPGYNYCGPGTKLKQRLERGDVGVNPLDEACKLHDISYSNEKQLPDRHRADKVLLTNALNRITSSDASLREKLAAMGVSAAMYGKIKLGMGNKYSRTLKKQQLLKLKHSNNKRLVSKKVLQRIMQNIKTMKNYLHKMQSLMNEIISVPNESTTRKCIKKPKIKKTKNDDSNKKDQKYENYHEKKIRQKLSDASSIDNTLLNDIKRSERKRKNINNSDDGNDVGKKRKLFEAAIEENLLRSINQEQQSEKNNAKNEPDLSKKRKFENVDDSEDEEYLTSKKIKTL